MAGNAEKVAKVQEVFDRRHYDLSQQMETERLNLLKGSYDTMAGLSPVLADQLGYKQQALEIELQLADAALTRAFNEGKITQDTYDQLRALRAVEAQAKRYNLDREGWSRGGGLGAGFTLYREEQDKRPAMFSGTWWKDNMTAAENWIGTNFANTAMNIFEGRKNDWRAMGKQMLMGLMGGGAQSIFRLLARGGGGLLGGGFSGGGMGNYRDAAMGAISDVQSFYLESQQAMTAASLAGDAARAASMASGAGQSIGILSSLAQGSILIDAGQSGAAAFRSVMQAVPFPANIILAPITAAAAFAATLAFGKGFGDGNAAIGGNATGNMSWSGTPSIYHDGGIVTAHGGLAPNEIMVKALRDEWILNPGATANLRALGGPDTFAQLNAGRLPVLLPPVAPVAPVGVSEPGEKQAAHISINVSGYKTEMVINGGRLPTRQEWKKLHRDNWDTFLEVAKEKGLNLRKH